MLNILKDNDSNEKNKICLNISFWRFYTFFLQIYFTHEIIP